MIQAKEPGSLSMDRPITNRIPTLLRVHTKKWFFPDLTLLKLKEMTCLVQSPGRELIGPESKPHEADIRTTDFG